MFVPIFLNRSYIDHIFIPANYILPDKRRLNSSLSNMSKLTDAVNRSRDTNKSAFEKVTALHSDGQG